MADDSHITDMLDSLSPLTKYGIDPDQARLDRAGTMAKLMGTDVAAPPSWLDQAQGNAPPAQTASIAGRVQPSVPAQTPTPAQPAQPAQSAIPASVTPSGNQMKSSLAAGNAATIGQMEQDYTKASQDVANEAIQPGIDTTTAALEAQRARDAKPINAYDPATGKVVAPYKPSFGQRLARGAEGVLRGGIFTPQAVLGAIDPAAVGGTGYGAPNAQYGRDVQQQQSKVASDDQQLKNAADNWKATSERLKQIAADRRALSTTGKDVTGASIAQQDQPNKDATAAAATENAATEAKRAYNESADGKAAITAAEFQTAQKQADQLGLKGQQRTLFLANGKLPDPRQPSEDEIATHQAAQIFTQQNGHPPQTLEEFNEVRRAAKGSDKQLDGNGKPLATTADRNRASLAHVADDNLVQIEDIVNRRPDLFGVGGGRLSSVEQMIGSDDRDLQALGNAAHNFAMANAGIHGSRSFENVQAAERELLNGLKSGPNGVRGAIDSNRQNLRTIIQRVEGGKDANAGKNNPGTFNWDNHPEAK